MIKITQGNVLESKVDGIKIIVHCCNDINSFGSGVAGNIARKWPHVKEQYHGWGNNALAKSPGPFVLGQIQIVATNEPDEYSYVCNLIGQRDIGGFVIGGVKVPPIRYEAIREGFLRLKERISEYRGDKPISIHSPLLGTGLAGGNLDRIYLIADEVFGRNSKAYEFTFYAFSDEDWKWLQSIHNAVNITQEEIEKLPKGRPNQIEYINSGYTDKM